MRHARHTSVTVLDQLIVDELVEDLDRGRTVLVAAFSAPLLGPLAANLRAAGVPHCDLTRRRPPPRSLRLAEALARYLVLDDREQPATARLWTGDDVRAWWPLCHPSRGGIRPGARHLVAALPAGPVPFELLADLWSDDTQRARALDPDPRWLLDAAKPGYRTRLQPLVAIAERNGPGALTRPPQLLLGTAHAVTAHVEVDTTYVAPDLTPWQADEWWSGRRGRLTQLAHAVMSAGIEVVRLSQVGRYALPLDLMVQPERGPR